MYMHVCSFAHPNSNNIGTLRKKVNNKNLAWHCFAEIGRDVSERRLDDMDVVDICLYLGL